MAFSGWCIFDMAAFKTPEVRQRREWWARCIGFSGVAIFLVCGSLMALARDLVS